MPKTSTGVKNYQMVIINRLKDIFTTSFAVVDVAESSDMTVEFRVKCDICNAIIREKSVSRHRMTCRREHHCHDAAPRSDGSAACDQQTPPRDAQIRRGPPSPTPRPASLLRLFHDSFTISPTTPPSAPVHHHDQLAESDQQTREFQDIVRRKLTTIENLLTPKHPSPDFSRTIELLIRWIATRSISFRAIESDLFHTFCKSLNPLFSIEDLIGWMERTDHSER
jgi:hypothetical protein